MDADGGGRVNDPGLYEWLALRRVADGSIARSAGVYFDQGRPVPGHLIEVFDWLVWSGMLLVADGDPIWELRRIRLSEAGEGRYEALGQQQWEREQGQHTELEVPPPEFGRGGGSGQRPIEGPSL